MAATMIFVLRWLHYFFGIIWIGHLYYFNFTQSEWFKEADAATKNQAITKLVPRALWWFRYGALFTFLTGALIYGDAFGRTGAAFLDGSLGIWISIGGLLATIMFLNVWLVIWPNQKIVIANAQAVLAGQPANPAAAAAGAKAGLASRHNTLFSVPMLFFMGAASHLPLNVTLDRSHVALWAFVFAVIGLLEINALKGKTGPITSVKGVITAGFILTALLVAGVSFLA